MFNFRTIWRGGPPDHGDLHQPLLPSYLFIPRQQEFTPTAIQTEISEVRRTCRNALFVGSIFSEYHDFWWKWKWGLGDRMLFRGWCDVVQPCEKNGPIQSQRLFQILFWWYGGALSQRYYYRAWILKSPLEKSSFLMVFEDFSTAG